VATYSLSGTGIQTLTANTTSIYLTITTLPIGTEAGAAHPPDYYDVGQIRLGDATGFFDAIVVVGGPQWIGLPIGCTRVGYAFGDAVVSMQEVIGGTRPFCCEVTDGGGNGGGGTSLVARAATITRSTQYNFTTTADHNITFDTELLDNDGMVDLATYNLGVTIQHAGLYLGTASIRKTAGTGYLEVRVLQLRGASEVWRVAGGTAGADAQPSVSGVFNCLVGDKLRAQFYSNAGGNSPTWGAPFLSVLGYTA
jgi:hypothetical protein